MSSINTSSASEFVARPSYPKNTFHCVEVDTRGMLYVFAWDQYQIETLLSPMFDEHGSVICSIDLRIELNSKGAFFNITDFHGVPDHFWFYLGAGLGFILPKEKKFIADLVKILDANEQMIADCLTSDQFRKALEYIPPRSTLEKISNAIAEVQP